jgi:hypothetical protein
MNNTSSHYYGIAARWYYCSYFTAEDPRHRDIHDLSQITQRGSESFETEILISLTPVLFLFSAIRFHEETGPSFWA